MDLAHPPPSGAAASLIFSAVVSLMAPSGLPPTINRRPASPFRRRAWRVVAVTDRERTVTTSGRPGIGSD